MKVTGLNKVLRNFNKEITAIEKRSRIGLTKSVLLIKNRSGKKTPVQYGNLKASSFIITGQGVGEAGKGGFQTKDKSGRKVQRQHSSKVAKVAGQIKRIKKPTAAIGYTAFYAVYVHENLAASHAKHDLKSGELRQIGQAKFLESALKESANQVLHILAKEANTK